MLLSWSPVRAPSGGCKADTLCSNTTKQGVASVALRKSNCCPRVSLSHGPVHHAVAVPAPPAGRPAAASPHLVDERGRRVQAAGRRGGGATVGTPQEQTQHEL